MRRVRFSATIDLILHRKLIDESKKLEFEDNVSLVLRQILKRHYGLMPKSNNGPRKTKRGS